jgi:hypothetical protein
MLRKPSRGFSMKDIVVSKKALASEESTIAAGPGEGTTIVMGQDTDSSDLRKQGSCCST